MISEIEREKEQKAQGETFFAKKSTDQLAECEEKLYTLLDMMLDKVISQEKYLAKKQKLLNQKWRFWKNHPLLRKKQ